MPILAEANQPAAGVAPPPPPKPPPAAAHHNVLRFRAYKAVAAEFVEGATYDPNELAMMLHDLRWDEVPQAFAVALHGAARRGPIRSNLGESFGGVISLSAIRAFASAERIAVQPWLLQNWDFFFVALIDGLLLINQKNSALCGRMPAFRRAVAAVFAMADAAKKYMSLDACAASSGIHAILAASASSRGSFIRNGIAQWCEAESLDGEGFDPAAKRELTLAHVVLVDMLAEAILKQPTRDLTTWNHAFGFYVGCSDWRDLSLRCLEYMPHTSCNKHIKNLEQDIGHAHTMLDHRAAALKHRLTCKRRLHGARAPPPPPSATVVSLLSEDDSDPPEAAEKAMERVPDPRSPNGTLDLDLVMAQGWAGRAREEPPPPPRKRCRDAAASPTEFVSERQTTPRRSASSPRRQTTPEGKPRATPKRRAAKENRVLDPLSKPASPKRSADEPPPMPFAIDDPTVRKHLQGLLDGAAQI